jgi:iron complex outermembrane receptor protein
VRNLALNVCSNPLSGYADNTNLDSTNTEVADNYERLNSLGTRLAMNWDLGGVKATAITAFMRNKRELNQDQDMSPASLIETPLWTDESKQFCGASLEFRQPRPVDLGGGCILPPRQVDRGCGFQLLQSFSPDQSQPYFDPANFIMAIGRHYQQTTTSKALFAQADYKILPKVTFTAGIRYTWDEKKLNFITYAGAVGGQAASRRRCSVCSIQIRTARPSMRRSRRRTTIISQRGAWRSTEGDAGRSALHLVQPGIPQRRAQHRGIVLDGGVYRSEAGADDAFEAGFKSDLFNRALRLNGATFYYKYHDMQVFTLQSVPGVLIPFQRLQNANSRIYGAELEAALRVVTGLTPMARHPTSMRNTPNCLIRSTET